MLLRLCSWLWNEDRLYQSANEDNADALCTSCSDHHKDYTENESINGENYASF